MPKRYSLCHPDPNKAPRFSFLSTAQRKRAWLVSIANLKAQSASSRNANCYNIFSHLVFEGAKSGRGLAALSGGKCGGRAEDGSEDGSLHHGGILAWMRIIQSESRSSYASMAGSTSISSEQEKDYSPGDFLKMTTHSNESSLKPNKHFSN